MFDTPAPRVFGLQPGADFPARLVDGVLARLSAGGPERLARVTIYLNTSGMRRRVAECFAARGATLLPRLRLITELADDPLLTGQGRAMSALGRRLELAVLIDGLLRKEASLAPRGALFDLADSLAGLMDEMRGEGVAPMTVAGLDVSGHSDHWARAQQFITLVEGFFATDSRPDGEARQRLAVLAQIARWQAVPPQDPMILAGSTGSRGTTALLMQAVAGLPQGAVVLPGYDFAMPSDVWDGMEDALTHEAHPQFRLRHVVAGLGLAHGDVRAWEATPPPNMARNRMISLSLRPAPVTDQWIRDGAGLGDLVAATEGMTLVEAPSPRHEALAIAYVLRQAVEGGKTACLISPDRDLTRRVAAALDRWGIRADDSAGQPLQQTAPGRLLRMVANGLGQALSVDLLLALLKHPLVHSSDARGPHLLLTRRLELWVRRHGPAFPDGAFLRGWAAVEKTEGAVEWAEALAVVLEAMVAAVPLPLGQMVRQHRALTEALAAGVGGGSGALWEKETGAEALAAMQELEAEAPESLRMTPGDYAPLLAGVLGRRQARSALLGDVRIQIMGAQETRVQGADLVILGGLTEGSWPEMPAPDPWLNRRLRRDAGLLLPERRVGLSAHDYQMAVAAPEVVLSRAERSAEAETVPSRWLNRLTNLLSGLPETGGQAALAAMRARGADILAQVAVLETPIAAAAVARPSPRPPVSARPRQLSITQVETLIIDSYATYASRILGLSSLNPLRPEADFRLRGEVVHEVLERFLKVAPLPQDPEEAAALLMQITEAVLVEVVPWPVMRLAWQARMQRIALPFAKATLAKDSTPVLLEKKAGVPLPGVEFTLIGKPDRIDCLPDGTLHVMDYKSGAPPSKKDMETHRKQLHLAAVMAWLGAFEELGPRETSKISYIAVKPGLKELEDELDAAKVAETLAQLVQLIKAYDDPATGYTAKRAALAQRGDYDHLSRFGEWSIVADAVAEDVGQ